MEGGAWEPIDPAKTYLVATNNYVRQGGDGYKVFADNAQNAYDYGPGLEQVVADYLAANRTRRRPTAASPRSRAAPASTESASPAARRSCRRRTARRRLADVPRGRGEPTRREP